MRSASARAEGAEEVREAARGWKRAEAIDANTFEEILRRFPEPRVLPSAVWRVLTALFVTVVILAALGSFAAAVRLSDTAAWQFLFMFFAFAALVAAEVQEASPRLSMRGGAGATSFWSVVFALVALALFLEERRLVPSDEAVTIWLVGAAALWAAACWRWGSPVYAAFSAMGFFACLARFPSGRLLWIAAGGALAFASARFFDEKRIAPSHRRALAVLCTASLIAMYGAVNVYSFDEGIIGQIGRAEGIIGQIGRAATRAPTGPHPALRLLAILGTVLLPFFVLAWGLRFHRTFLIDVGVFLTALSFVTLRHYVPIAPLWAILTGAGALLLGLALFTERRLRRAREGEIGGFTAEPLFEDERKRRTLELVPVVAGYGARTSTTSPEPNRFEGGGGSGGGGGSTDSY